MQIEKSLNDRIQTAYEQTFDLLMELHCDQCGASFTGTYEAGQNEINN